MIEMISAMDVAEEASTVVQGVGIVSEQNTKRPLWIAPGDHATEVVNRGSHMNMIVEEE